MNRPLLSQICHDLRAPLAAVTMGAGFVLQTTKDDPRSQRVVEAMLRSCAHMERLIRIFADLSELDAGDIALDIGDQPASAIVDAVLDAVVTDKDIELKSSVPETPLIVRCDVERLKRALGHIVGFAVERSPAGSAVSLDATAHEGGVQFTVKDRGRLPEAADVFDRQSHPAGLALTIARGFARAHGGDLRYERRDETSVFALSIPRDPAATGKK